MNWSGKTLLGILLVGFGVCAFFGAFGIHLGGLIGLVIGIALAYYGVKRLKDGHKGVGVISLIIGLMILTGSLPFLIGLALAAACIYFGWKMIKRNDHPEPAPAFGGDDTYTYKDVKVEDSFETEWKDFLKKHRNDDDSNSSL